MAEVIDKLKPYLSGWKVYFGLAQTPGVCGCWTNGYATDCEQSNSGNGDEEASFSGN
ncbi:MAG: hypothetical protein LV471_01805 [Nitrosomonas sp.]|nr:hypothetical protein [Nitrosomonas sp.]